MTGLALPPPGTIGGTVSSLLDAAGKFFSTLANLHWGSLALALLCFLAYLTLRSRAVFNALRAAYPDRRFQWRRVWGAYIAGLGLNNVLPAGGGNVLSLFLVKHSIPEAAYPTVGAAVSTAGVFDAAMSVLIMIFAFTQGVFPKPPDFSKLSAFDLAYLAGHPRFTLFLITALGVLFVVGFALLSARVRAFWARVRQGFTILRDWRRWRREMALLQAAGWIARTAAMWFMLDAFGVGGSLRNALLVLGVQTVATIVPLTPGGAGIQQALLVAVFSHSAPTATVLAYSAGQQIALALLTLGVGFLALSLIFRLHSFKEAVEMGRSDRAAAGAKAG
jgi:uncharacterized membrane protein YbhN (UPF0104 family)